MFKTHFSDTLHQWHNSLSSYFRHAVGNHLLNKRLSRFAWSAYLHVCGWICLVKDITGMEGMTTNVLFLLEQFWLLYIDTIMTTMGGNKNIPGVKSFKFKLHVNDWQIIIFSPDCLPKTKLISLIWPLTWIYKSYLKHKMFQTDSHKACISSAP